MGALGLFLLRCAITLAAVSLVAAAGYTAWIHRFAWIALFHVPYLGLALGAAIGLAVLGLSAGFLNYVWSDDGLFS